MNRTITTTNAPPASALGQGLNRLVAAAVVNQNFCRLLLSKPAQALARGYQGEEFELDHDEADLVLSIRANDLTDFARQLVNLHECQTRKKRCGGSGNWVPTQYSSVVLESE